MSQTSLLEKCCLIGQSVTGNPTHFMVEQAFAAAGIDWRFLTFEVNESKLVDALRGAAALGFSGMLLLPSLQRLSWEHISKHTDRADQTRSVSILLRREDRLIGDDLAGESVAACIVRSHPIAGRHAAVLGLEGRGLATAFALLQHGAASLRVVDFGHEEGEPLINRLRAAYPDHPIESIDADEQYIDLPAEVNLIMCASCWAKERDPLTAEALAGSLRGDMVVADARVRAGLSPLLHAAADRGAKVVTGVEILTREIAEAIRLWTGVEPPEDVLMDAAEEFLGV
ncbi:Shikimate dehydrogenase [Posidoniimonas polymericola]|uniref:Shikimate dehydrogenase n=1 Tax=Posidoniimonas polymericola TaxID=2528002 RepID=A0A5C5ZES1_9BACT|nr:hypothetical protein [Posidoniimonas polymericola]TWT85656.1 Shikimate dehydrogenase [Posidoniimonas polymericola]